MDTCAVTVTGDSDVTVTMADTVEVTETMAVTVTGTSVIVAATKVAHSPPNVTSSSRCVVGAISSWHRTLWTDCSPCITRFQLHS